MINFGLTESQIERLHQATLLALEQVGILIEHVSARHKLEKAGCKIEGERVLIPTELVVEAIQQIPGPFNVFGTRGDFQFELGRDSLGAMTLGGSPRIYNPLLHESRTATSNDVANAALIADWADHVTIFAALFGQDDVPGPMTEIWEYKITIQNFAKVFNASIYTSAGVHFITEMAAVVSGGLENLRQKPSLIYSICPISPLRYTYELTEAIIAVANYGMPLSIVPLPVLGVSAPITSSGALVQQNAEVLAAIVIAYQYRSGIPILYNGLISSADMRRGLSIWGNPEIGLMGAFTSQLSKFYNLPCKVYGFGTSVETLDIQTGMDRSLNALMAAIAKPTLLGGVGSGGNLASASLEQIIIDNEILDRIHFYLQDYQFGEDELALAEIKEAVLGTSFLEQMHTVEHLRSGVLWSSQFNDLVNENRSKKNNENVFVITAQKIVDEIIQNHSVEPLPDSVNTELENIVKRAQKELLN